MRHMTRIVWVFGFFVAAMSASACSKNAADTTSDERAAALVTIHGQSADGGNTDAATASNCAKRTRRGATPCSSCMRRADASDCAQRTVGGGAALEDARARERRAPEYEHRGAPAGTDALATQLRTHHAEDAPVGVALRDVGGAEQALHYLAENGELMLERQRALAYLRHFPSDETRALLLRVASSDELRSGLRATALRSLAEISDPDDEDVQELRILLDRPASEDVLRRAAPTIESTTEELP